MSYTFYGHEGLVSVLVDGNLAEPFMYIDAKDPPPWWVEPVGGARLGPFPTLEAAKVALIFNLKKET